MSIKFIRKMQSTQTDRKKLLPTNKITHNLLLEIDNYFDPFRIKINVYKYLNADSLWNNLTEFKLKQRRILDK